MTDEEKRLKRNEYQRLYRQKNKDKIQKYMREYMHEYLKDETHREKINNASAKWRKENPEKFKQSLENWKDKNYDYLREYRKNYYKTKKN